MISIEPRQFKDFIYREFSCIGKAISSPKRIELLDLLTQGPKSVETLTADAGMSVANTSKHLQSLLGANLVTYSKQKNYVIYQLASEQVRSFVLALRDMAEDRSPDVNRIREDYIFKNNTLESISFEELSSSLENETVTLLDVRPSEEFTSNHLPHAISIPITNLENKLNMLPKDKKVVAYCRGPYCVYATEAVELLRKKGYDAAILNAGINEWKQYNS